MQKQSVALTDLHHRKDEFLAMLSHELRNPLAPIINAVELLSLQSNEGEVQQEARTIIERQVGQLTRLVDDLLEVSRITTGKIHLQKERIGLNRIVERAVETTRPLMDLHRHELTVTLSPQPIWLDADVARMEQVIVNLLTNAPKQTGPCLRVLVVDDNVDAAETLGLLLKASRHNVRTAYDGPTALKVAVEFRPKAEIQSQTEIVGTFRRLQGDDVLPTHATH